MTRNSKVAGLALVSMLATSAIMASGASATTTPLQATAGSYPAVLTGNPILHKAGEVEPFVHSIITSGGAVVTCKKFSFVSTISAATVNVTVIPRYEECSAKVGAETLPVTITMEDCDFIDHGGVTEEPNSDTFKEGTIDLVCPAEKSVVIHLFTGAAKHAANESLCTLTIAPFISKGENTFHNETGATDAVSITSTVPNIPMTRTGSVICGAVNQSVTYTGSTTVKAFVDEGVEAPSNGILKEIKEGNQVSLTVSETP